MERCKQQRARLHTIRCGHRLWPAPPPCTLAATPLCALTASVTFAQLPACHEQASSLLWTMSCHRRWPLQRFPARCSSLLTPHHTSTRCVNPLPGRQSPLVPDARPLLCASVGDMSIWAVTPGHAEAPRAGSFASLLSSSSISSSMRPRPPLAPRRTLASRRLEHAPRRGERMSADGTGGATAHEPPVAQALDVKVVATWRCAPLAVERVEANAAALWRRRQWRPCGRARGGPTHASGSTQCTTGPRVASVGPVAQDVV